MMCVNTPPLCTVKVGLDLPESHYMCDLSREGGPEANVQYLPLPVLS